MTEQQIVQPRDTKFDKYSFASANVFPLKTIFHRKLVYNIRYYGRILPIHLQLNPTNQCMFACSFCSCSKRVRTQEIPFNELVSIMEQLEQYGCSAVTITGGGEPFLYSNVRGMVTLLTDLGIDIGLVSNGVKLNQLFNLPTSKIIWSRISSSDELPHQLTTIGTTLDDWFATMHEVFSSHTRIDWAFSHVLTGEQGYDVTKRIIEFANDHHCTHVRLVCDIFNADNLYRWMDQRETQLHDDGVDTSIVNFQSRSTYIHGSHQCWLPLMKPVLGADSFWYSCCGSQYIKLKDPARDYESFTKITPFPGVKGLIDFVESQRPFDGIVCERCYYDQYNRALSFLRLGEIKHANHL